MEGITDATYRLAVMKLFPEWQLFATDFLRIPTEGHLTKDRIINHFGADIYHNEKLKNKTILQILTTSRANTSQAIELINQLKFPHLDLNLGCPSRKVNGHGGGSFLLQDLKSLEKILTSIRNNFNNIFTVKIRTGYKDDNQFKEILLLIEELGIDAVTIHGRTRDQFYKGTANWDYFNIASETIKIPIIANGDIWTLNDIDRVFKESNCHAIMCARSAMKTPWLANLYALHKSGFNVNNPQLQLNLRKRFLKQYFAQLEKYYKKQSLPNEKILKKFKALVRYVFEDFQYIGEATKKVHLRSKSLEHFNDLLKSNYSKLNQDFLLANSSPQ